MNVITVPEFMNFFSGMLPIRKLSTRELARALRFSLAADEEAIHLYEALADVSDNTLAKTILQDIANEKVHARVPTTLYPPSRRREQMAAGRW